jgi:hypothetical protein
LLEKPRARDIQTNYVMTGRAAAVQGTGRANLPIP